MSTSDTEATEQESVETAVEAAEAPVTTDAVERRSGLHPDLADRLIYPIVIPALAAILVIGSAVAISRLFLSGKSSDVVIATILTVGVLILMAALSAARRLRGSSNRLWVGGGLIVLLLAGLIGTSYSSESGGEEAYVEPEGEPVATIEATAVNAGAPIALSAGSVPEGVIQIDGKNMAGHDFQFKDPALKGFSVTPTKASEKVELAAGTYTLFCVIPGHQAMVADLTVG